MEKLDSTIAMICLAVVGVVLLLASCTYGESKLIAEAARSGSDPVGVACAVRPGQMPQGLCIARSSNGR